MSICVGMEDARIVFVLHPYSVLIVSWSHRTYTGETYTNLYEYSLSIDMYKLDVLSC
jgi:hypothetical protein